MTSKHLLIAAQIIIDSANSTLRGVTQMLTGDIEVSDAVSKVIIHLRAVNAILNAASDNIQKELDSL